MKPPLGRQIRVGHCTSRGAQMDADVELIDAHLFGCLITGDVTMTDGTSTIVDCKIIGSVRCRDARQVITSIIENGSITVERDTGR